jgi:hypothetical protein
LICSSASAHICESLGACLAHDAQRIIPSAFESERVRHRSGLKA